MTLKSNWSAGDVFSSSDANAIATAVNSAATTIAAISLTPTSVHTGNFTASAGDIGVCDASSGGFTVTLPTGVAAGVQICVKKIDSSANIVTVALSGSDVFNKSGGSTSLQLKLPNQALTVQYKSGIWYVVSDDQPLAQLDTRFAAHTAQDRVFDARDYGAKGDGTTDDTAAIHAARDAAGVGGTVVFPPGTYKIVGNNDGSGCLQANVANQVWNIMPGATLIQYNHARALITVSAAGVTLTGGGTLNGGRDTLGDNAYNVLAVIMGTVTSDDLSVIGLSIQKASYWGIWGQGSHTRVLRCKFTLNYHAPVLLSSFRLAEQIGSTMHDTYDMEASDNYIDRTAEGTSIHSAGIQIKGNIDTTGGALVHTTYRARALRNVILMPASPTETTGTTCGIEIASSYPLVEGNMIVNGTMGISFAAAQYPKAIGNTMTGQTLTAIELADSPGAVVQGNVIDGQGVLGTLSSSCGIWFDGSGLSNNVSVVGNRIFGLTSTGWGISLGYVSRVTIAGNSIGTRLGIIGTGISDSTVSGNSICGTGDGTGILLSNSSSVVVTGNAVQSQGSGVRIDASSGTSDYINVSNNHFRTCTTPVNGTTSGSGALGTNIVNASNVVRAS